MSDRSSDLEAKIAELAESLRQIEGRVAALERGAAGSPAAARRAAPVVGAGRREAAATAPSKPADITKGLSLGGRTLLVLAGAFVLRALTDSGTLPVWLGVGLGFAYAGTWIAMADRAGRAGQASSAGFHGVAAIVIGFPLLFEATSRFRLLSPVLAAATLTLFTAVTLGVASRRRLQILAWLGELGGLPTAIALMFVSGRLAAPATYLVLLGVATLWLGYIRGWVYLRWPIALVADVVVVIMGLSVIRPNAAEGPRAAFLVQFALMALYLGSIATRTLLLKRHVVVFEVLQTAAAILVGLGGAALVALRSGMGARGFGVASTVLGVAAYAVAFAFIERQQKGRANFYFYASVAMVFVLAGTSLMLSVRALPLAWSALAVVTGLLARRQRRLVLGAHSATYAVAGAIASGLLARAVETTVASPADAWTPSSPGSLVVLAAMAVSAWLTGSAARSTTFERVVQVLFLAALAVAAAGELIGRLVLFAGTPGAGANPAAVATIRTAVLVGGVLLLAWLGRFDTWLEAGWLAYPVLAAIGLKILLEDLARGRPATLFLSFAFYGAALILVPRFRHSRARPALPASGAPDRLGRPTGS